MTALHVFPKFSGSPYGTFGPAEDVLEEAHRNQAHAEGDRLFATLRKSAQRLRRPLSAVVREAIRDYSDRIGNLSEEERRRMLEIFDRMVPRIPSARTRSWTWTCCS